MESNQILDFVDEKSLNKPKRLFSVARNESDKTKKRLAKLYAKLTVILTRLKPYSGEFAPKAVRIMNSIVYKYGHAYKRHMFLRHARHAYSLAKKLSKEQVYPLIKQLASGLNDSFYEHSLTENAIDHVCAVILHRIVMLDKLRIVCAKNVEFSIGYVELKHNINLNLLFIALATEFGSLALTQIRVLIKTYNELRAFFTSQTQRPIPCVSELPIKSCVIGDQNEIVERTIDRKDCDLDGFISFLKECDESEDALDEFEQARLEEIYRILRNQTASVDSKKELKLGVEQQDQSFYRAIPKDNKKRKRKNK